MLNTILHIKFKFNKQPVIITFNCGKFGLIPFLFRSALGEFEKEVQLQHRTQT